MIDNANAPKHSPAKGRIFMLGGVVLLGILLAAIINDRTHVVGHDESFNEGEQAAITQARFDTTIKLPDGIGTLRTDQQDIHGNAVGVACSTCHADRATTKTIYQADELTEFHTDMTFNHGELSCTSCHAVDDRDKLQLADGRQIEYADTMALCAQCHGTQYRSYQNGAHGGMSGHWDLSKGPRTRNHCVTCHNPHDPAFPVLTPAPPPRDRFFHQQNDH